MKKLTATFRFFSLMVLTLFVVSCGKKNNEPKLLTDFFDAYNVQDTQKLASLSTLGKDFSDFMENMHAELGDFIDRDLYRKELKKQDSNQLSLYYYKIDAEKSDVPIYMRFEVIKADSNDLIHGFFYANDKGFIDSMDIYEAEAEAVVDKFFKAWQNKNYTLMYNYFDQNDFDEQNITSYFSDLDSKLNGGIKSYEQWSNNFSNDKNTLVYTFYYLCRSADDEIFYSELRLSNVHGDFQIVSFDAKPEMSDF